MRIVIGLFLGYGYYNAMRGTFPQQLRSIAQDLAVPLGRLGLPSSMFSAAYGVGKFVTCLASDYVPCAEFFAFGVLLSGLAVAALGFCDDFSSLAWLWGFQGVLQAFGWPFLARVVVDELPAADRAKYWGALSMAGNVGAMLAPYGMVLAARCGLSWRGAFVGAGCSAAFLAFQVWWLLCRGPCYRAPAAALSPVSKASAASAPVRQQPSALAAVASVFSSPALLVLMVCNMLSFGSSKCMKEWGAVYLRSTHLSNSDVQTATLLFWAEVGGSAGAFFSGMTSSYLGGRHALTCLLSAALASVSLGILAWSSYAASPLHGGAGGVAPLSFAATCFLQAVSLAGVNGVRTLAGLHGAEIAARSGMVGMANGWLEMVGQIGSIMAGQPLGALAAYAAASVDSQSAGLDAPAGGVTILSVLAFASVGLALLNASLLPQEARWLARKAGKAE